MVTFILSYIPSLGKYEQDPDGFSNEYPHPCSLLTLVPANYIIESRKEKLLLVEYSRLLERSGGGACKEDDFEYAICLHRSKA